MTFTLDRRGLLAGMGAAAAGVGTSGAVSAPRAPAPGLAVTIDDFDLTETPLLSGPARDIAIRAALSRHRIKAGGFVAGKYLGIAAAPEAVQAWSDAGHIIGNHSFSHRAFSGADHTGMIADVLKCEDLLAGYPSFRKLFRFPYLAEGKTAQGRDAMRSQLAAAGYRNAHVTIDTSDWAIDNRLKARLMADPRADLSPYRRFYLQHLWDRAVYYDGLAKALFGHSIDHTILLHHRLTTALFLGDALTMFRARGWRLVDAAAAFASPAFAKVPQALPAGQSLLWALAKSEPRIAATLRFPGEDVSYEAPAMDALKL